MKLETAINKLNEIAEKVENGGASLEETLKLYKEGLKLSQTCETILSKYEEEITVLQKESEGLFKQTVFEVEP